MKNAGWSEIVTWVSGKVWVLVKVKGKGLLLVSFQGHVLLLFVVRRHEGHVRTWSVRERRIMHRMKNEARMTDEKRYNDEKGQTLTLATTTSFFASIF